MQDFEYTSAKMLYYKLQPKNHEFYFRAETIFSTTDTKFNTSSRQQKAKSYRIVFEATDSIFLTLSRL